MTSTFESLRFETVQGIGVVTFATPARLNAISERRLDELEAVLTLAEKDDALAVVSTADEEKEQVIVTLRQQIARLTSDLTGEIHILQVYYY